MAIHQLVCQTPSLMKTNVWKNCFILVFQNPRHSFNIFAFIIYYETVNHNEYVGINILWFWKVLFISYEVGLLCLKLRQFIQHFFQASTVAQTNLNAGKVWKTVNKYFHEKNLHYLAGKIVLYSLFCFFWKLSGLSCVWTYRLLLILHYNIFIIFGQNLLFLKVREISRYNSQISLWNVVIFEFTFLRKMMLRLC